MWAPKQQHQLADAYILSAKDHVACGDGMSVPVEQRTATIDGPTRAQMVDTLRGVLPPGCLLYESEDTRPYECDGLTLYRQLPMIVALPETESQVARVLQLCHSWQVPVVPRGAGTGLSGGALPHASGVTLSLTKLNRILSINAAARTATVQPGVRNLAISEAAAQYGLYYAPDPSSQIACTIGGNVAENSGGVHCLKYGLTLHNVLRIRALTMNGEVLEFGSLALDCPGVDLLSAVIGSEGMLAVVVEITVKLVPKPQLARCIMASFNEVTEACGAVAALIGAGIVPAGLEMLDQSAVRLVEPFAHAGYDQDAAALLLCESDGTTEEVSEEVELMSQVLRQAGAARLRVSNSEAERLRFWQGRKSAFPAAGRAAPAYYCMDGTIPRRHLAEMLDAIRTMETTYGLRCPNVFHAGDGNLHPLVLFDDADPHEVARAEAFGAAILEKTIALGGTISGEHGIGVEKLDQMCSQFDPVTLSAFTAVKSAFDPSGLLNPGKVVPTLHRCGEYRQRGGSGPKPFSDLPRF
jgi:glycolate oxidase